MPAECLRTKHRNSNSAGRSSGLRLIRPRTTFPWNASVAITLRVKVVLLLRVRTTMRLVHSGFKSSGPRRSQQRPCNGFAPFSLLSPCFPVESGEPVETNLECLRIQWPVASGQPERRLKQHSSVAAFARMRANAAQPAFLRMRLQKNQARSYRIIFEERMATMFRVKESEKIQGFRIAERVLQGTLLVALLANLASLSSDHWPLTTSHLSLIVSTILMCSLAAFWWLRRCYLSSEQSFREVKMLAHDILASMDRGVVTTNREGVITSINTVGIRLLEVDFECVGQPLASISTAEVPLGDVHREVVESETAVLDRDFNVDRAGRVLRLRVDGHSLKDTKGQTLGCVVHLRNVTERKLLEERMRRMERFLSLATLASGLHHEIKNPLTALSIHIQLLEEHLAEGKCSPHAPREDNPHAERDDYTHAVDELVGVLKTEVCRLNGVLESFRSFANLQHLSLEPTDALGILENAVRLIRPQAAEQRVQITLLHPEKELPRVPLDAEKFEQVILNLIINALEAMPEGGTLTVGASVVDGEFRVSVKDSGPGIPSEVQKNLFLPYFSTKTKGSGMGLALSEKLISQHGGHIDYRTGPGGTTFDITVPLELGDR